MDDIHSIIAVADDLWSAYRSWQRVWMIRRPQRPYREWWRYIVSNDDDFVWASAARRRLSDQCVSWVARTACVKHHPRLSPPTPAISLSIILWFVSDSTEFKASIFDKQYVACRVPQKQFWQPRTCRLLAYLSFGDPRASERLRLSVTALSGILAPQHWSRITCWTHHLGKHLEANCYQRKWGVLGRWTWRNMQSRCRSNSVPEPLAGLFYATVQILAPTPDTTAPKRNDLAPQLFVHRSNLHTSDMAAHCYAAEARAEIVISIELASWSPISRNSLLNLFTSSFSPGKSIAQFCDSLWLPLDGPSA